MEWNFFDPSTDDDLKLPDKKGVYLVCVRDINCLPNFMKDLTYCNIENNKVIYVGISKSKRGLRSRDYHHHFEGNNAGQSTLRKSLGVLIYPGCEKIDRNKNCKRSQYKFAMCIETKLTTWMKKNLILYYRVVDNPSDDEIELIKEYSPPLNINKNYSEINLEFRKYLRKLRKNCCKRDRT